MRAEEPYRMDALEPRRLLAGELAISEIMASNANGLMDLDGDRPDWIEIHNTTGGPINLQGYYLTDNAADLTGWQFPSYTLGANQYVVVFASGKDRATNGEFHTDFSLNVGGEYLALVSPDGTTVMSSFGAVGYPRQQTDLSYGPDRNTAGNPNRYYAMPTPGQANVRAEVVINELHVNPDVKTQQVEFIELYNPTSVVINLSEAFFSAGVDYEFPANTLMAPGQYLVIAENAQHYQMRFGAAPFGQFSGKLSNEGETVRLKNKGGGELDVVDYGLGFPWPTVGDAPGYSMELIHPDLDNNLGGSWRSYRPPAPTPEQTYVAAGSTWHYRKGLSEVSSPITAWRQPGFVEDSSWFTNGVAPLGYGESFIRTDLSDMNNATRPPGYTTVYLRKTFTVSDLSQIASLRLEAQFDDGFNVWINGKFAIGSNVPGQELNYDAVASGSIENTQFVSLGIPGSAASYLNVGSNVIAVQALNHSLNTSSDFFFDMRLIGVPITVPQASPSPGLVNSVYATNAAPQMRQVQHGPVTPASNQPVTITAKVTDPDGVGSASLAYQLVNPGQYIALTDPEYQTNWTSVAMRDDGTNGDATAGDGVYTVVLPPGIQQHRRLVRYRITATDSLGASITAPYADDPQPNFAYFVYDGIPNYRGAIQPGSTNPARAQVTTYGPDVMNSVPAYHLITKAQSHQDAMHIPNAGPEFPNGYTGDNYLWSGALVYDGIVYDHVRYRARGGVWRYAMGKNMWKFDLNRGHEFAARDPYGNPYPVKWSKINLGANIQQGNFAQRGEQGLFEHVGFQLFNLAGVPSSNTAPIQLRIVEGASEIGDPNNQYDDDFQGLYLAIEQDDGKFLDSHELPDGNFYRMENGTGPGNGTLNNQGATQPSDHSDLVNFRNTLLGTNPVPTEQWLRDNIDLESYYSYRSMVEAIHHWDIGFGKNYYWYHNPETNKWVQVPWDLDLTWTTTYEPTNGDNEPFKTPVFAKPQLLLEYRNRLREIRDLLFNVEQVGLMLDEYAALVDEAAAPSMVDADRAMWDYNPILVSSYLSPANSGKGGNGRFYESAPGNTFEGMVQKLKNYVSTRSAYIDNLILTADEEENAPRKPTISYVGSGGFAVDDLRFASSAFASGFKGGTFAGMKWRLADVTPAAGGMPPNYEINSIWESDELTSFDPNVRIPAGVVKAGHVYRVRVRMVDSDGRWSHWSDPIQFTPGAIGSDVVSSLRITEMNYHPDEPGIGSEFTENDFEWVELKNISDHTINLNGVEFMNGITFTFGNINLAPGQHVLVVEDREAFADRYGEVGFVIAGEFDAGNNLSDGGENILLVDAGGATIHNFTYDDAAPWQTSADGGGATLVVVNLNAPVSNWSSPANWRASVFTHGTPGADESTLPANAVVISEALTHTNASTGDWIELQNTTGSPIDIGGWWLSDSNENRQKYQIPMGTIIPANGFVVFTQFGNFDVVNVPFGLSEYGERIVLSAANEAGALAGYRQSVSFGAAEKEVTFGRVVTSTGADFAALAAPTIGSTNTVPRVAPVVITEIMYNPAVGGDEFIEIRNVSNATVNFAEAGDPTRSWRFLDGVTFVFSAGMALAAGQSALIVGIDPATFRAKYGIPAGVSIFGPYTGVLDNGGERLTLAKYGTPDAGQAVPYIAVDSIVYDDVAPWPTSADGGGASLGRVNPAAYGNDVVNWVAEPAGGSPGGASGADFTAPTVDVIDVHPDPRDGSVDGVSIVFSEAVNGLTLAGLRLVRDGVNVPLGSAGETLTTSDGVTWTLRGITRHIFAAADYEVQVLPGGVADVAGNPMGSGANDTFVVSQTVIDGTAGADQLTVRRNGSNIEVVQTGTSTVEYSGPITPFSATVIFNTFAGDDVITVDFSGGDPFAGGSLRLNARGSRFDPPDRVSITGTAGNDTIVLDDAGLLFNSTRIYPGRVGVMDINGDLGNDTFNVNSAFANYTLGFRGGGGTNAMTIETGKHVVSADAGTGTTMTINGSARVDFAATQNLAGFNLNGSARAIFAANLVTGGTLSLSDSTRLEMTPSGARQLRAGNLFIGVSALLEMNDNDMLLRPVAAARDALYNSVRQWLINGRGNGTWNGTTGITSTSARNNLSRTTGLFVMKNTDNGTTRLLASFAGQGSLTVNDLLLKYTWTGDNDFNGRITVDDYYRVDRGFLGRRTDYRNGDITYDSVVNLDDYTRLDTAWLGQGTTTL